MLSGSSPVEQLHALVTNMGTALLEISKTKIDPTHRTLFVDTSTSVINQLKDMLLHFQPKPITTLPSIKPHIPLAQATSNIPRIPFLTAKSVLKAPAREQWVITILEQRVYVTRKESKLPHTEY